MSVAGRRTDALFNSRRTASVKNDGSVYVKPKNTIIRYYAPGSCPALLFSTLLLMQSWRVVLRSLALSAFVVSATVGFLQCSDFFQHGTVSARVARYQVAQRQTVLVATDNAQGSGFTIIREDIHGKRHVFVWTAAHVVEGVNTAQVKVVLRHNLHKAGLATFDARVVYRARVDAALLEVDADPSRFINTKFDFYTPEIGTAIHHIGNLFGIAFDGSLTTGVLSQIGVMPGEGWPWPLLDQTTALAVPGSSGGPIFNSDNGKVLGILVGGPGTPGVSCYVPVRELAKDVNKFDWMLRGSWCPSDEVLSMMAEIAFVKFQPILMLKLR